MTHQTSSSSVATRTEIGDQRGESVAEAGGRVPRRATRKKLIERIARWVVGGAALGYGASFLVHLILILCCSLVVVAGARMEGTGLIAGLSPGSGGGDEGFDQAFDTSVNLPTGEVSVLSVSPLEMAPAENSEVAEPVLAAKALASVGIGGSGKGAGSGDGEGEGGEGQGSGHKFRMPSGGNVVRQGNFTAWTVPQDPAPGEIYSIVIQIKLPNRVKTYRSNDLSGTVVGTDRYRQELPGDQPRHLPVKNHSVQLEILVPGAAETVQDTIRIRSKLLNEEQELRIVF